MGTYVISDIHGCYDEFMKMIEKIGFSKDDELILAGDYIDRGKQNCEVLRWISSSPLNVTLLKGNHDIDFCNYIDIMDQMRMREYPDMDIKNNVDTRILYEKIYRIFNEDSDGIFDHYGTLNQLIKKKNICFVELLKWSKLINRMSYYAERRINGRRCIAVHAGYIDSLYDSYLHGKYNSRETFFIYARDDAYIRGGVENGMIIAGHTPTINSGEITSNQGMVYRFYNEQKDCIYYDIDCGCVFSRADSNGKLACLRIEDEAVFYV